MAQSWVKMKSAGNNQSGANRRHLLFGIRLGRMLAPDRCRPGGIIAFAHNHVHMQLADDIPQRADVHFVGGQALIEQLCQGSRFLPQRLLICDIQLKHFADTVYAWHQDEPRVIRVIGQQQAAEREVSNGQCVLLQALV
jgi:hypothetical protein